jgi:N-acyl-phosphatidylethanolamine-hydrolysing phospholipase D
VRTVLILFLVFGVVFTDLATFAAAPTPTATLPAHHAAHGYRNTSPEYAYSVFTRAVNFVRRGFEAPPRRGPAPVVVSNDGHELRANGQLPTVTWVGHSTLLVQIDGVNILTDPHWGDRASPLNFAGPRRLVAPGLRFEDLPHIDLVVISHDHYDHLDEATVRRLAREHRPRFFVPLGLKAWLADVGITDVVELDWWQARRFHNLVLTCTPAQHSSGRGLRDQNLRLWASWTIAGPGRRFFFAGDTGYWPGFKEIGQRLGPFDLAAIPIGGYSAYDGRHPNHVNPEEALQVLEDVRGRRMIPIHFGTFALNREPFKEPPDRLFAEAHRRRVEDHVAMLSPGETIHW